MKINKLLSITIIGLAFMGCDMNSQSIVKENNINKSTNTTEVSSICQNTNTVMIINGIHVSAQECLEQAELMIILNENKNDTLFQSDIRKKMLAKYLAKMPKFFITRIGFLNEMHDRNFKAGNISEAFWRRYLVKVRRPRQSLMSLLETVPDKFSQLIEKNMEYDYSVNKFIHICFSNELTVTANEIDNARKNIIAYNDNVSKTNELVKTKAQQVKNMFVNGMSLSHIASIFSEDEWNDDRTNIVEYTENEFDDPTIWNKLVNLSENKLSDIIEIDEGYAVFFKLKSDDPEIVRVYRIFFRKAVELEPMDDDEIEAELFSDKYQNVMKSILNRIFLIVLSNMLIVLNRHSFRSFLQNEKNNLFYFNDNILFSGYYLSAE